MKEHSHKSKDCLNCGYHFTDADNFCPSCGQENHSLNVPFRHILLEVFEGTVHFDTKIFKTFYSLLLKPGFLTSEFNSGRRVQYVPPIKVYVFVSFFFFLLLNLLSSHQESHVATGEKDKHKDETSFSIQLGDVNSKELAGLNEKQSDSLLAKKGLKENSFDKSLFQRLRKLENEGSKEFTHTLIKNISYLMFLIMPVFALILYLFHLKREQFYFEFLIYSIHIHSFLFLLFSIYVLISQIFSSDLVLLIVWLITVVYFYISLRKVFPQRRLMAAMKTLAIFVLHGILTMVLFVGTVIVSLYIF